MELRQLLPHQERALAFARKQTHLALFMEMRLMKTLVTIRWHKELGSKHVVVVAPIEALEGWEKDLSLDGEDYIMTHGMNRSQREQAIIDCYERGESGCRTWLLCTYGGLRSIPDLGVIPWDGVILDESTVTRNPKNVTTQLVCGSFGSVKHRAILTGYYAPEGLMDAFCQFLFLDGKFMGCTNFYDWRSRYFQLSGDPRDRYTWHPKLGTREAIRKAVRERAFILTRKQAKLPTNKVYMTRTVDMSAEQAKLYRQASKEFAYTARDGRLVETIFKIETHTWLERLCGGFHPDGSGMVNPAKMNDLITLLSTELKGKSVVVWYRFNEELYEATHRMRQAGIKCDFIKGGVLRKYRKDKLASHRRGEIQVLNMQVGCGRFGMDASHADTAIYYSNGWSNETRAQTEERIELPGKPNGTLVIDYQTKGCIDGEVIQRLKDKAFDTKWLMARLAEGI